MLPREVFLSHSSEDYEFATRIADVVRDHGVPVFYSPMNLVGGQQWQDEILSALRRCDWFLVLLTPSAISSTWVRREVAVALNDRRYDQRIVPLMYQSCDLGSLAWLEQFHFVSFKDDFADGCRDLLRIWGLALKSRDV